MAELTEADRDAIKRARELSEPAPVAVIRERTGETAITLALIAELAKARELLADLAGRLERHGS